MRGSTTLVAAQIVHVPRPTSRVHEFEPNVDYYHKSVYVRQPVSSQGKDECLLLFKCDRSTQRPGILVVVSSQNTPESISRQLLLILSWGRMPPDPPSPLAAPVTYAVIFGKIDFFPELQNLTLAHIILN